MATVDLTEQTFENTVLGEGIVLVDFWAEWCGPCKAFGPVYEEVSNQGLSGALGIQSIPTLMIFRDGIGVFQQAGALPRPALDSLVEQVRALNMDEVRAQVAAQQSGDAPA